MMAQAQSSLVNTLAAQLAAWNQSHPANLRIDPKAEFAVAQQEGLGGGIGDNGTSFGPNQLHIGGAYPSFAPQQPQQAEQWASSPTGINYTLGRIASVAGGLTGAPAVNSIVSRFERPYDPQDEIAHALSAYGLPATAASTAAAPASGAPLLAPAKAAPQKPTLNGSALDKIAKFLLGPSAKGF